MIVKESRCEEDGNGFEKEWKLHKLDVTQKKHQKRDMRQSNNLLSEREDARSLRIATV